MSYEHSLATSSEDFVKWIRGFVEDGPPSVSWMRRMQEYGEARTWWRQGKPELGVQKYYARYRSHSHDEWVEAIEAADAAMLPRLSSKGKGKGYLLPTISSRNKQH